MARGHQLSFIVVCVSLPADRYGPQPMHVLEMTGLSPYAVGQSPTIA